MRKSSSTGLLLLEDGTVFEGHATTPGTSFGEVVFNTSMTGYQEILTDPSYHRQIVVMTTPHIGNYGVRKEVEESSQIWPQAFVARSLTSRPSGSIAATSLVDYLAEREIPTLSQVDTRAIVRHLRTRGAMRGVISDQVERLDELREELAKTASMAGQALVDAVTRAEPTELAARGHEVSHIALYDFGAKANIAESLTARGSRVTVLPANTPAKKCLELQVDGVVLSNGPGDPAPLEAQIETAKDLMASEIPIFGICLGHQLLALALGADTYKLPFGHHGGNQPVRDELDKRVSITSQNHGFAVEESTLPATCKVTHRNLNDGTIEGFAVVGRPVFGVQFHPEAAPGPHDTTDLFDRFLDVCAKHSAETSRTETS